MGAESGMNSSVRDDRVALSDGAKALWGKTNRIDDSEWLPLYVHMVDSAAMASKIWDTWVPQGTKAVIVGDLGNDEVLARKLMIFMAGIHDIGKATPVFQAKSITFGPEAGSFAWKAERAGLPMIAGLRGTNHPTHPIAGEIILEGYLLRVRGWERKAARQYACVVGGHHGTPPDKSKIDEEKNRKTNVGLDSEAWVSTQDELIDFVANIDTKFDSERYRLFGNNQDIPVWEREDPPSTDLNDQNRFVGPVQAMTWQSRRVRLVPSEDNARIIGIMSCYGDVVAPYNTAWKDEIHRRLLQMGWEYLDQSSVPVFGEHESGVVGVMGASRAQLLFQSKLNKELGFLEEKDASRPNKGGM